MTEQDKINSVAEQSFKAMAELGVTGMYESFSVLRGMIAQELYNQSEQAKSQAEAHKMQSEALMDTYNKLVK